MGDVIVKLFVSLCFCWKERRASTGRDCWMQWSPLSSVQEVQKYWYNQIQCGMGIQQNYWYIEIQCGIGIWIGDVLAAADRMNLVKWNTIRHNLLTSTTVIHGCRSIEVPPRLGLLTAPYHLFILTFIYDIYICMRDLIRCKLPRENIIIESCYQYTTAYFWTTQHHHVSFLLLLFKTRQAS